MTMTVAWSQDWPGAEKLQISLHTDNWDDKATQQVENFLASILRGSFRISGKDTEDGNRVFCIETIGEIDGRKS